MLPVLSALMALAVVAQVPTDALPKPADIQPAAEYLNWSGFGFLPAGDRAVGGDFRLSGDWSAVAAQAGQKPDPNAVPWHLKIFVLRRVDRIAKLQDGTLYEEQCALENPDVERVRRSVDQLKALVQLETHGKLALVPDLYIEPDPVLLGEGSLEDKVRAYIYPRINGGSYEDENHVFWGPFASAICIHPVPMTDEFTQTIDETPVTSISGYGPPDYDSDGLFAIALERAWVAQVRTLAKGSGVQGPLKGVPVLESATGLEDPLRYVPAEDWAAILAGPELDAQKINSRLQLPVDVDQIVQASEKLFIAGYRGAFNDVRLEVDPEKGSVLTYSERGSARAGGLDLPGLASHAPVITVSRTPTLEFWCRSHSADPLALRLSSSNGKTSYICLGRDLSGDVPIQQSAFDRDGTWHLVKLDLARTGLPDVASLALVPTPDSRFHPKLTLGPIEYSFAAFQATKDAPDPEPGPIDPDPDSKDAMARARWAHSAAPSAKLLALLKDPNWSVRLNALARYEGTTDASIEQPLTENATMAIDGAVNASALKDLWTLGTPTAKSTVLQAIATGVTEPGKSMAAQLEAGSENADPSLLIGLTQARTLETRIAVVRALAKIPGTPSAIERMSMLPQVDPELKLEITRTLDPSQAEELRELRWSAVDEPSDAVRAESDLILIGSKDPSIYSDGYKGIKDDSIGVRLILLRAFAERHDEDDRPAIRIAVTDHSSRVRAAALRAFAALPKPVSLDELGGVVNDRHPIVQSALVELALAKHLQYSQDTVNALRNSPDPEVRAAANRLP